MAFSYPFQVCKLQPKSWPVPVTSITQTVLPWIAKSLWNRSSWRSRPNMLIFHKTFWNPLPCEYSTPSQLSRLNTPRFLWLPSFHKPSPSPNCNNAICATLNRSQIHALISEIPLTLYGPDCLLSPTSGLFYFLLHALFPPPSPYCRPNGLLKTPNFIFLSVYINSRWIPKSYLESPL